MVNVVLITPTDIFVLAQSNILNRGHRCKLPPTYLSTDPRPCLFSIRCVHLWNSLPDNVVPLGTIDSLSLLYIELLDQLFLIFKSSCLKLPFSYIYPDYTSYLMQYKPDITPNSALGPQQPHQMLKSITGLCQLCGLA